ncbi:hypothetical protein BOTBODRAFT_28784 [Botryobasidium botryosum FD-172 SS1]|uniref:Peptidase S1 domain-containing protein n=1 Tax=Botryobasidium botryosum (strain FD-172 SS1) TaxID=930990 RepID=A0A067MRL6_BOTB1|nr:hypothetical protein BOTBODRAFT_28784 [Botryobasidium botryosum FD-172 SS1]
MDPSAPFLPSDLEAANFYYGLESKPILVARSDRDAWVPFQGSYTYVEAKVLTPLGPHPLSLVWDETISVAMESYLQEQDVQYTSMTPLRIGIDGQASPLAVIFMGVRHGSLTREKGYEVAIHCHGILVQNNITDIHVQIRESEASLSGASLFKPAITANIAYNLRQPFSTSLGIPICNAATTHFEGTGGFYLTHSGKLFMVTARHVVFDPNTTKNERYEYKDGTGARRINVMFLGKAAFDARVQDIKSKIDGQRANIEFLEKRSTLADGLEEDEAAAERRAVQREMSEAEEAIGVFEKLQKDVMRDWADETKRIIGHVVFSPRLGFSVGEGRYTEDWAVIEIHPDVITKRNFVGNAIDLGHVAAANFKELMYPSPANPHSFDYPGDRLHRCRGILSDKDMLNPDPRTKDQDNEPTIMAIQNGNVSGLQIGRVNDIRSVVRRYFENQPGVSSREVAVLPRTSKSGPFSKPGDSGAVVVAGDGRICGLLTGGDGITETSDITYLTPIDFIIARMKHFGITGNFFPSADDIA